MSCESDIRNVLRDTGRRVTTPRLRIASVLRHAGGHRTAQQIHEAVTGDDAASVISLSTVYRTLETLRAMRLVAEVDEGGGAPPTSGWTPRSRTTTSSARAAARSTRSAASYSSG